MQISCIQTNVTFAGKDENLNQMAETMRREAALGSRLVVFPECFLTGYCFNSLDEAVSEAEPVPGPSTDAITEMCRENDCFAVVGTLEKDEGRLFNVAVLIGPDGLVGYYRKTHLPYLGVDRFTTFGDRGYEIFEADGVKIGLLICYDGGFPEASRVLALQGADLILLPTNWPPGAEYMSSYSINARAMENGVYFAAVNRIGTERGFRFIGKSRICDPVGATMESVDHDAPAVLRAGIDVQKSRQKRIVRVPGQHVIDRLADRRPELYGPICEEHSLPRPGREEPV